ncbi:MAG: serine hydrolase domain-containing protein [Sphingomicrobium sp.]
MKRHVLLGLFALCLTRPAAAAGPDRATLAQIDRIFADWQRAAHAPGLVYGVVADGRLIAVHGFGVEDLAANAPVTSDSRFRIASMSKAFTALAILKLRDEGKVSLDAPAENYVPELKHWAHPTSDSPRITVRNLLTHTAGFVEDNPWGDRQQVMAEADFTALLRAGVPFARAPGLAMEYSNLGYAILGRIISNASNTRYQDYIKQEIMVPLDMTSTGYDIFASLPGARSIGYRWQDNRWLREPDMRDGAFGAMGGVETTASDYSKWVAFLLSAWPARDGADNGPVLRSSVREIVTGNNLIEGIARDTAIGGPPCRQARAYAMGWRVTDDCDLGRVAAHGGGYPGYGSYVLLLPDKGVGLFAFSSLTYGGAYLPTWRAALALGKAGALADRTIPVSSGLAAAYANAQAVWRAGDIGTAPLANNVIMDRDRAAWAKLITEVKALTGDCAGTEAVVPISAMEGKFSWACSHGRVDGRVQRAPTPGVALQALEFAPAAP